MDAVQPEEFPSLEDINPTLHQMAMEEPPIIPPYEGEDNFKSSESNNSFDNINPTLQLMDKPASKVQESEEDIDKSLSNITLALLQDNSSRSSSDEEDEHVL